MILQNSDNNNIDTSLIKHEWTSGTSAIKTAEILKLPVIVVAKYYATWNDELITSAWKRKSLQEENYKKYLKITITITRIALAIIASLTLFAIYNSQAMPV